MRDKDRDKFYEDKPYYGIKGLKKVNNLWIAGVSSSTLYKCCLKWI